MTLVVNAVFLCCCFCCCHQKYLTQTVVHISASLSFLPQLRPLVTSTTTVVVVISAAFAGIIAHTFPGSLCHVTFMVEVQ